MNWDAVGARLRPTAAAVAAGTTAPAGGCSMKAIGEILGAIAVLVTLGYLAPQVRHAREQMSRGVRGARRSESSKP